jgi:hypothetical protein
MQSRGSTAITRSNAKLEPESGKLSSQDDLLALVLQLACDVGTAGQTEQQHGCSNDDLYVLVSDLIERSDTSICSPGATLNARCISPLSMSTA